MSNAGAAAHPVGNGASGGGLLAAIEKVGNKVPHPVILFLYLIAFHHSELQHPCANAGTAVRP
jgi:hypothetical protein